MTCLELGTRIRALRRARGWTQEALGWHLTPARSHAAVSDLERGLTGLDIAEITMVADVFNVRLDVLLFWPIARLREVTP